MKSRVTRLSYLCAEYERRAQHISGIGCWSCRHRAVQVLDCDIADMHEEIAKKNIAALESYGVESIIVSEFPGQS